MASVEIVLDWWERPPSTAGHMVGALALQGAGGGHTTEGSRGQGMLGKEVGIKPDQGRVLSRRET